MNKLKLSNNLSVDNVINSYKRCGYYSQQLDVIRKGLEKGFDVSIYDDIRFDYRQMNEIFIGLTRNLDVSVYANAKYSSVVMKYASQALSHGVQGDKLVKYLENKHYDSSQLNQIFMGLCDNLDVSKFDSVMYHSNKMNEIRTGLVNGVDISQYVDNSFNHQMREIRQGLEAELDVSIYANNKFESLQMTQLRLGLAKGIDASKYALTRLSNLEMQFVRDALEKGIKVDLLLKEGLRYDEMKNIHNKLISDRVVKICAR